MDPESSSAVGTYVLRATGQSALGRVLVTGERIKGRGLEPAERTLACFGLIRVTGGEGSFWDDDTASTRVRAGDVLLLRPGVAHGYGPDEGGYWAEQYCTFEGAVFDLWAAAGLLPGRSHLGQVAWSTAWDETFRQLLEPDGGTVTGLRSLCLVQTLLAMLVDDARPVPAARAEVWIAQAQEELRRVATSSAGLQDVAAELGLSLGAFRRRFTEAVGIGPGRYRALARIDLACDLLTTTTLTHRRIAERLGFTDEAHFSKRFTALVGTSPRTFRATLPG